MPETSVGLSDNSLLGNLIATTRPSVSNQGAQTSSINPVQSDPESDDGENNIDNIPFQEILGQHMQNSNIPDTLHSPLPNTPVVASANTGLTQPPVTETNPSLFFNQTQNTTETASALQKMLAQRPGIPLHGFRSNPSSGSGKTAESADLNTYPPAPNILNRDIPTSPFVPPAQRGKGWGFEETKGSRELPENQSIETSSPVPMFSAGKLFPYDINIAHTPAKADSFTLNPLNNPENPQIIGDSLIDDMQQFNPSEVNMRELPEAYKLSAQNISPKNKRGTESTTVSNSSNPSEQHTESSLSEINGAVSSHQGISCASQSDEKSNAFGNSTREGNAPDTASSDAQVHKTNNGAHFSLGSQTDGNNAQSSASDFQHNTHASVNNSAPLSPSSADDKTTNPLMYGSSKPGVEHTQENIMEQIFQKIRLTTHGDRSEIKLSLTPPELGSVKIHLTEEHDEIRAKIFVENAEVKAAIENNAHHFKESVASGGIEIHKLEVHIQNDDAYRQNLVDNSDAYNQPHSHAHGQEWRGDERIHNEEEATNTIQTEHSNHTSDLTVDYII